LAGWLLSSLADYSESYYSTHLFFFFACSGEIMSTITYVSKHAFQGDMRQAQLSFPAGASIVAKPNQQGAWWWGACNGKEGWFPPSYVAAAGAPPPPQMGIMPPANAAFPHQQQQQASMQQRMQQATFTSSVQQAQQQRSYAGVPPPNAFPTGGGGPPPGAFATARPPQPQYEPDDPFAGLDNLPSATGGGPPPLSTPAMASSTPPPLPSPTNGAPTTSSMASLSGSSKPPVPRPSPTSSSASQSAAVDPTAAAFARMGITPPASMSNPPASSRNASPVPHTQSSRNASPVPPSSSRSVGGAAGSSKQQPVAASSRSASPAVPSSAAFAQAATNPTGGTSAPVKLTAEEKEARRLREQEDARQKAQMRRDREELSRVNQRDSSSDGLGSSGAALPSSGASGGGVQVGADLAGSFNPYDFLVGTSGKLPERKFSPIWRVPPFWALLNLNTYIHQQPVPPEKLKDRAAMYEQLARSLSFVSHVCAETASQHRAGRIRNNPIAFLSDNHMACEACVKLISLLPHSAGASGATLDGLFLNYINVFISLFEAVQPNQQLVLPGGWQQPDYTYVCLYIIRNCGNNRWSFTVCNTGNDGLQYHPSSSDPETGKELKQLAMTIWDIPAARLLDSSFWILLFRMQVYPSKKNNAAFLYTKLLPALNSRPLRSNLDQGPAEYLDLPDPVTAQSYHPLARLALTTTPAAGTRPSKYAHLLVMNAACELAYKEIEKAPPSSMDPEDTRILKLSGRNLANFASTINPNTIGDGTLGASLSDTWDLLDMLFRKLNFASSKPMDQYSHGLPPSAMNDDFSKGKILSLKTGPGSAAHPLFGRLRRDNYDEVVKKLMGDPRPDPIVIPPVLTDEELPPVATDYMTASSYLQRIADACSLLLQQRRLIKNSPAFAASAAQYALTTVLPMPNADPKFCFWRKGEMRRETQLNLLFLIRRLCRIYSASTACVQQSRGLIAIRSITFACGACVADAISRVVAVDDPSTFALHYSGLCEGPTEPFGIEAGAFDTLGSNLPIYDPNICSLRFQCLDYLRGLTVKKDGTKKNTIFNFDKSLSPTKGDLILLDQLSINLALQRPYPPSEQAMMNHAANLISGRNGSVIEVLPEFEYFRDIVFHFKHAVSGKAQTPDVPDTHTWLPSDATLHWEVRRRDKEDPILVYYVKAFQAHHQEFVERIAQQEEPKAQKSSFQGFLSLFAAKTRIERSRLSSADPTTVVNSCGEKFQNKRCVSFAHYSGFLSTFFCLLCLTTAHMLLFWNCMIIERNRSR